MSGRYLGVLCLTALQLLCDAALAGEEQGAPTELNVELRAGYMSLAPGMLHFSPDTGFRASTARLHAPHGDLTLNYRSEYGVRFYVGAPAIYLTGLGVSNSFVVGDLYTGLSVPLWNQYGVLPAASIGISGTGPTGKKGVFGGDSASVATNIELSYDFSGRHSFLIGATVAAVAGLEEKRAFPAVAAYSGLSFGIDDRHRVSLTVGANANVEIHDKSRYIIDEHRSYFTAVELSRYDRGKKQIGLSISAQDIGKDASYWGHISVPLTLK